MTTWLSPGGTLAALAVGGLVAIGLGWAGLALLCAFFLSSTLLTPGGGRRRAGQVVANGGVAAAAAMLAPGHPAWTAAFAGALAAAAADTWSTEIGARSRREPRLITTGNPVAAGTSGGVTWLGTAAGATGAAFIAAGETPRPCCGRSPDLAGGVRWMTNDTVNLLATVTGAGVALLPVVAGVATLPLP